MNIELKSDQLCTIAGQRGTGKTFKAKELIAGMERVIIYDPVGEYDPNFSYVPETDSVEEFEGFMKKIWFMGNVMVVVDEAERFMRNNGVIMPYTYKVINTGRHRNIGMIMITRRLAELHKTPFGLSAVVILFRLFSPGDITYISGFLPNAEEVAGLADYKYKVYKPG